MSRSEIGSEFPPGPRGNGSSPAALAHLSHLDIPRPESPGGGASSDFATGYSLGLIGVRSWASFYSLFKRQSGGQDNC